jgi:hypothetical protein
MRSTDNLPGGTRHKAGMQMKMKKGFLRSDIDSNCMAQRYVQRANYIIPGTIAYDTKLPV